MDERITDDWLDKRLQEEMPYIDDAGFTARVMQQIPRAQPRRSFRAAILIVLALLAGAIVYALTDGAHFIAEAFVRLTMLPLETLLLVAVGVGVLALGAATAAALKTAHDSR